MVQSLETPFGQCLRYWRRQRSLSQLELSGLAQVSCRHVSFLETGRSRPSRQMVLCLAEALDLTLRDANHLLEVAGHSPAYPARNLSHQQMGPLRRIVEEMLTNHMPFPGFAIDRLWNVVLANDVARMLPGFDVPLPTDGIELFFGPGPIREAMLNWDEVASSGWSRLRREVLHAGDDPILRGRLERLEKLIDGVSIPSTPPDMDEPAMTTRLQLGDEVITTIGTVVQFTTARDVLLQELRVELLYPADSETERFFRALAFHSAGTGALG